MDLEVRKLYGFVMEKRYLAKIYFDSIPIQNVEP